MARTNGPLFSLGASGKLANALVYGTWKGINTVRQYVVPANPQTAAQITQRAKISSAVNAWKNYFIEAAGRSAWNRIALLYPGAMSGFNAFTRNVVNFIATTPDASFVDVIVRSGGQTVAANTLNIDDGAVGDEAGDFEIWVGPTATGMTLNEEVAIAGGNIIGTNDLGDPGDIVYAKIRKDSIDRSGIFVLTLN